jgi:hypothetical protein
MFYRINIVLVCRGNLLYLETLMLDAYVKMESPPSGQVVL